MMDAEPGFTRAGVDPVSRCTICGAAVAAQGQDEHRAWHIRVERLLAARPDIATIDMF